jgi:hypothetical protein
MRIDIYLAVAGLVAGCGSALLLQWVSARVPRVDFWLPAASLARSLVSIEDDGNFPSRYGELLKLLAQYLGRQVLTLALPIFAVATVAMLILPQLADRSTSRPKNADSVPASEVAIQDREIQPASQDDPERPASRDSWSAHAGGTAVAANYTPAAPAEEIIPAAARDDSPVSEPIDRPASRIPPRTPDSQWILPFGQKQSDVTFFLALCVGSGAGAILPLRKK